MKKLHLRNIIKEVLKEEKGYSRYVDGGTTKGLTKDTLDKILLRIANGDAEVTEDEDQVARGNKVLDRADPENVARILRGEEPVYNEEVDRMQELAGIQSEIKVNNPLEIDEKILKIEDRVNNLLERWYDEGDDYPIDVDKEDKNIKTKYNYINGDLSQVKDKLGLYNAFKDLYKRMKESNYGEEY